jgi:membrane protein DedA with SNARE-associated domain
MSIKSFLRIAGAPIVVLGILVNLYIAWNVFDLPSKEALISVARDYFATYGYYFAFVSAFIEGLLFINWYFPGSFIVFLSVIIAGEGELNIFLVLSVVVLGFFLASLVDYLVGKYGWYRLFLKLGLSEPIEKSKEKLLKRGPWILLAMYWHPNFGAISATAAGILMIPFRKFLIYCATALIFWDSFWGTLVYFLGPKALRLMDIRLGIVLIAVWVICLFMQAKRRVESSVKME